MSEKVVRYQLARTVRSVCCAKQMVLVCESGKANELECPACDARYALPEGV